MSRMQETGGLHARYLICMAWSTSGWRSKVITLSRELPPTSIPCENEPCFLSTLEFTLQDLYNLGSSFEVRFSSEEAYHCMHEIGCVRTISDRTFESAETAEISSELTRESGELVSVELGL